MFCPKCGNHNANSSNFCFKCGNKLKPNINFNNQPTSIFKNGILTGLMYSHVGTLYDNRELIYNSRYIISDGKTYDLEDIGSITRIATPKFDSFQNTSMGVCGDLTYILRMKASNLKNNGKITEAITLLKRVTEMMPFSSVLWQKTDYMRLPNWLLENGEFETADDYVDFINNLFANHTNNLLQFELKNAKALKTDLVEADYFKGCCSECAKYRGRWFSISGRDRRFPKLPINYCCTCQGLNFSPVFYGISEPIYCPKNKNIIAWSNRPFIDDRSQKEKSIYQHYLDEIQYEIIKRKEKRNYYKLSHIMPEEAPKSFPAYMRMKNQNTKNFIKLAHKAKEMNLDIQYSYHEKLLVNRYLKYEKSIQIK